MMCDITNKYEWMNEWMKNREKREIKDPRNWVPIRYVKHSTQCFIWYPGTWKSALKNLSVSRFSSHISLSAYWMKRVFHVLHINPLVTAIE